LKLAIDPASASPARAVPLKFRQHQAISRPQPTLVTVMAHPVFAEPMYRALRDISAEFLAPNLGLIPNNTISLLETNQRFIEAYMVGLNDEMGRELLWRQFPTDQRGSYFRQFWDVGDAIERDASKPPAKAEEDLLDISKLHTWGRETQLGDPTHANRPLPTGAEPGEARLVLVVRGDLLKTYPTAVIYAQQAKWITDDEGRQLRVLMRAIRVIKTLISKRRSIRQPFDLTSSKVGHAIQPSQSGWFFVIQSVWRAALTGRPTMNRLRRREPNELAREHPPIGNPGASTSACTCRMNRRSPRNPQPFRWGRNTRTAYIFIRCR
jgi:hypothetical protein